MSDETQTRRAYEAAMMEFLNRVWIRPKECPICGTASWQIGDLAHHRSFQGASPWSMLDGGRATPVALVYCANCGYELAFNALLANVPILPISETGATEGPAS